MKALMLGWEFPPHISGGLGTACYGLTRGLAHHGVEVLFVVPRAFGDEDRRFATVVGAGDVPIAKAAGVDDVLAALPEVGLQPGGPVARELESLAERMRVLAVDSALRPYMSDASYVEAVKAMSAERERAEAEARAIVSEMGAEGLSFSGSYGPDLMSEVARYARVIAELAVREDFDVVHAHDWMTYPAGIIAARLTGRPLVVHLHASEYDRSGENVNTAVRDIEQLGMEAADRVVCVSHYLASLVRRRYGIAPEKLRVVHNAVTHDEQLAAWHAEKPIDEPIVLFLGRVTFQKGPDYFLEAAARVLAVEPNVKFVVSGSGDMLPRIVEQAAQLGIARHVHFTGFLRGKDVERMYAMADIYVMPSVSEPFGISPLEAMASDVPVIVSNQSGVSEVVRHALKVDFWDVDDIANKILALLRYPELREQLTSDGRGEVLGQRWEVRGGMVRDIYEELVA